MRIFFRKENIKRHVTTIIYKWFRLNDQTTRERGPPYTVKNLTNSIIISQWRIKDFPEGGHKPQISGYQPIILVYLPQNLHENEKKSDTDGGVRPWRPLWSYQSCSHDFCGLRGESTHKNKQIF